MKLDKNTKKELKRRLKQRKLLTFSTIFFCFFEYVFFLTFYKTLVVEAILLQFPIIYIYSFSFLKQRQLLKDIRFARSLIILFFIMVFPIFFLINHQRDLELRAKENNIHYIFWSDPFEAPKDIKDMNNDKEISFMIATNEWYLKGNKFSQIYNLLDNGIEVMIVLVGNDFAHVDNSQEMLDLFYILRNCSFYERIDEIYIDAEISKYIHEDIKDLKGLERSVYWVNNYPSKETYRKAIKEYNLLSDLIKEDGKEFGIIRGIRSSKELDKTSRNIPFEYIKCDRTVVMVYRSHESPYQEKNDYWFYQTVKREREDVFIGDFKEGYKEFRKDLTVCSFFEKKRIYIFEYKEFIKHYTLEDLRPKEKCIISYTFYDTYEYFWIHFVIEIIELIFILRNFYIFCIICLTYIIKRLFCG